MTTKVKYSHHLSRLGVTKLKPEQKNIITSVINRKDTLAILPTGFGKSLCYVLPHLITNRNVIVVSPLVSLIRDQELKYMRICNTFVMTGSRIAFNGQDGMNVSNDISSGTTKALIFMTPETLLNRRSWITNIDILTIAIDECHCITEWANFRQGYSELSRIVSWFIHRPSILAVTATATSNTEKTIIDFFQLENTTKVRVSAVRSDLELFVEQKKGIAKDIKYIEKIASGKTIVYCKTRKDTEKLTSRLRCIGGVANYHAGMAVSDRELVQDEFTSGKCRVIVATNAFGMGVDIPDISTVIHYGLPKDVDSYCQEIGRAARSPDINGKCYVLWGKADFAVNTMFINNIHDPQEKNYQQKKSWAINRYIDNCSVCRMHYLAAYFDPQVKISKCLKCDICKNTKNDKKEPVCVDVKRKDTSTNVFANYALDSTLICEGL